MERAQHVYEITLQIKCNITRLKKKIYSDKINTTIQYTELVLQSFRASYRQQNNCLFTTV